MRMKTLPIIAAALLVAAPPAHAQIGGLLKKAAKAAGKKAVAPAPASTGYHYAEVTDDVVAKLIQVRSLERQQLQRLGDQNAEIRQARARRSTYDQCGPQLFAATQKLAELSREEWKQMAAPGSTDERLKRADAIELQKRAIKVPHCEAPDAARPDAAVADAALEAALAQAGMSADDYRAHLEHLVAYFFGPPEAKAAPIPAADRRRAELMTALNQLPQYDFVNPQITTALLDDVIAARRDENTINDRRSAWEDCSHKVTPAGSTPGKGATVEQLVEQLRPAMEAAAKAQDIARMQQLGDSVRKLMGAGGMPPMGAGANGAMVPTGGHFFPGVTVQIAVQCGQEPEFVPQLHGLMPIQYRTLLERINEFLSHRTSEGYLQSEAQIGFSATEFAALKSKVTALAALP